MISILVISCTGKKEKEIEKYSISQLHKNIRISGGKFSADDSKILFSSNETGIYNVFEINIRDRSKKQVTNSTPNLVLP